MAHATLAVVLLAVAVAATAPAPADLVLTGAAGYTMDAARSWAEAVAVQDGRIVFVGTAKDAQARVGPHTRVLDLEGVQVAVTRQSPNEEPGEAMQPEEAIDLPEALAAHTIGAAYAMGLEKETGSIEAGKRADLVVLERNLFDVPAHRLGQTGVLLTLLDGKVVYEDPARSR